MGQYSNQHGSQLTNRKWFSEPCGNTRLHQLSFPIFRGISYELFTCVGHKKNTAYIMTIVNRATRGITAWAVVWERSEAVLQQLLDSPPYALTYYSDGSLLYQAGINAGVHHAIPDKSQTYSVEGDNAVLRHYLARLARASRCFSRCLHALYNAVKLFVFAWNRCQLALRHFPTYPAHLLSFAI